MSKKNQNQQDTRSQQAQGKSSDPSPLVPNSPDVSTPLEANSDAASDATATAPAENTPETPIASPSVQSWTPETLAKAEGLTKQQRAFCRLHVALAAAQTLMQHTGAAYAACTDVHFRGLHTQAQRIHQQLAESLAHRSEFRGLWLGEIEKEVAQNTPG